MLFSRFRGFSLALLIFGCLITGLGVASVRARSDADLPDRFRVYPYTQMSLSVGSPGDGWQLRAKKLRASSRLRLKNPERNAVYGHPALVLMLQRTGEQMGREAGGAALLVGDLSTEFGGALAGHRSHQSGRDADVGFFALDARGRSRQLDRLIAFDGEGKAKDGSGLRFDDYRNWLLVQMWLRDQRAVVRWVFVSSPLRQRLLDFARERPAFRQYGDAAAKLLVQPRNSSAHDDHFHVRVACPKTQDGLCLEAGHLQD